MALNDIIVPKQNSLGLFEETVLTASGIGAESSLTIGRYTLGNTNNIIPGDFKNHLAIYRVTGSSPGVIGLPTPVSTGNSLTVYIEAMVGGGTGLIRISGQYVNDEELEASESITFVSTRDDLPNTPIYWAASERGYKRFFQQRADWQSSNIDHPSFILNKPDIFQGASEFVTGRQGFVPAPDILDRNKYLKGDGNWTQPTATDVGAVPADYLPYDQRVPKKLRITITGGGSLPPGQDINLTPVTELDWVGFLGGRPLYRQVGVNEQQNLQGEPSIGLYWEEHINGGSWAIVEFLNGNPFFRQITLLDNPLELLPNAWINSNNGQPFLGSISITEVDNDLINSSSHIIVQPGDDIQNKYFQATQLQPNGQSKSATNRASLIVLPGSYSVTGVFNLNEEFVDIIGLGAIKQQRGCIPAVKIIATGNPAITAQADNLVVKGINTNGRIYLNSNKPNQIFEDCSADKFLISADVNTCILNGYFINCSGGTQSFNSIRTGGGGASVTRISGATFENCIVGNSSFGGDSNAWVSGNFINCQAGDSSFAVGGTTSFLYGYFTDCQAGDSSFGRAFNSTVSGIFNNCSAGRESFNVAPTGRLNGYFKNCSAGELSFGSLLITGLLAATFENCSADFNSFGGTGNSLIFAKLYNCRLTSGNFATVSGEGLMRNCIDGNNNIIDK